MNAIITGAQKELERRSQLSWPKMAIIWQYVQGISRSLEHFAEELKYTGVKIFS